MSRFPLFLVLACLLLSSLSCKSREQRRLDLANYVGSKDPAQRAQGEEGMKKLVSEDPSDTKARHWLALAYLQDGKSDLCKAELREIIARSKDPKEIAEAKDELAKVEAKSAPGASSSASAAPPAAAQVIPIVLGKSAGGVSLGDSFAQMEAALGPCSISMESPPVRVCNYPDRGMDVGLRDLKIIRIGLYRDSRVVPTTDFHDRRYATYCGSSAEGVSVGMTREELVRALGEPKTKGKAVGMGSNADGSFRIEVVNYPDRGASFELDVSKEGIRVGAIQLSAIQGASKSR